MDLERKNVPLRKWKSPHSHQWWTIQYTRISRAAWRRLNTLQSRWTSLKVQRAESLLSTNPMGVWLTAKGEGEVHFAHPHTNTRTNTQYWTKKTEERYVFFFSVVAIAPGVCHPGLEEGLHFTDGRADVGRGLSAQGFWLRDLVSVLEEGVECGKQAVWQCAAGLKNKKSIKSKAN